MEVNFHFQPASMGDHRERCRAIRGQADARGVGSLTAPLLILSQIQRADHKQSVPAGHAAFHLSAGEPLVPDNASPRAAFRMRARWHSLKPARGPSECSALTRRKGRASSPPLIGAKRPPPAGVVFARNTTPSRAVYSFLRKGIFMTIKVIIRCHASP